jgi:hypothetical protein
MCEAYSLHFPLYSYGNGNSIVVTTYFSEKVPLPRQPQSVQVHPGPAHRPPTAGTSSGVLTPQPDPL